MVDLAYIASKSQNVGGGEIPPGTTITVNIVMPGLYGPVDQTIGVTREHKDPSTRCRAIYDLLATCPVFRPIAVLPGTRYPPKRNAWSNLSPDTTLVRVLRHLMYRSGTTVREVTRADELVTGVPQRLQQFRVFAHAHSLEDNYPGAPATRGQPYPTLFAFHGSAVENWLSVLHRGFTLEKIANDRFYGDGVYTSFEGGVSLYGYSKLNQVPPRSAAANGIRRVLGLTQVITKNLRHTEPDILCKDVGELRVVYLLVEYEDEGLGTPGPGDKDARVETDSSKQRIYPGAVLNMGSTRVEIPRWDV